MRISDWSSDVCSSDLDGWSPAAQFAQLASGRRVRVAGIVLLRQRPGTASGVIFSTIEDETGVANIVLWPRVFERFRKTVLTASPARTSVASGTRVSVRVDLGGRRALDTKKKKT